MQQMNRRRLFTLLGFGTVLAAGLAVPAFRRASTEQTELLQFRATLGLPEPPLPNYATYVIEGTLNLVAGTGVVTSRVLAGHPDALSNIGLPGLGGTMNVTRIQRQDGQLMVRGRMEDRSPLQRGELHELELLIDQTRRVVRAPFADRSVVLTLA